MANATGCSSIYGGNLPTTPYCTDHNGRGPAWSNSLFEDNAEYGLGLRAGVDQLDVQAKRLLSELAPQLPAELVTTLTTTDQGKDAGIATVRKAVVELKKLLPAITDDRAIVLLQLADYLVRKSVWIIGGDGWAYDIGFGGLDHVLATGRKVNILVLDTEVYSNTGGQRSKSTPLGAVAKFSAAGKDTDKKDLALIAMQYAGVYVAKIAFGAKDSQTMQAFLEAEAHPGPSLIIAYSHCIAHGYALSQGLDQQKLAVETGYWPLFRHNPARLEQGLPATVMDSPAPKQPLSNYTRNELRFQVLHKSDPERAAMLAKRAQIAVDAKQVTYRYLASQGADAVPPPAAAAAAAVAVVTQPKQEKTP